MKLSESLPRVLLCVWVCLLLCGSAGLAAAGSESAQARLAALNHFIDDTRAHAHFRPALIAHYRAAFPADSDGSTLQSADLDSLDAHFQAAYLVVFYTGSEGVTPMQQAFSELQRRGEAGEEHLRRMFQSLVQTRDLGAARSLQLAAGEAAGALEALPEEIDHSDGDDARRYWEVDPQALRVQRRSWPGQAMEIIAIGHPHCSPSRRAVAAISGDPRLAALFAERALWLAPQDGTLSIEVLQRFNHQHPDMRHRIAYRESEWPQIADWSTPQFYFFRGGRLVRQVSGWPPEGQVEALIEAAQQAGMLP